MKRIFSHIGTGIHKFDECDFEQMQKARELILKVYEYHYGDSKMQSEIKRLETIISKLDYLIELKG